MVQDGGAHVCFELGLTLYICTVRTVDEDKRLPTNCFYLITTLGKGKKANIELAGFVVP